MSRVLPQNANEFIEQELDARIVKLETEFDADALAFCGQIYFGVDDIVRNAIEGLAARSSKRDRLAVMLTTSGGLIEVVHRIVDTLRAYYKTVIFVIPNYAFSAGTVLAMSGDEIHMDYYSRLGPIDPQVESANGQWVPALGYLVQWERLLKKANNGTLTLQEAQLMIQGFDQAELYKYEQARELSVTLLAEWLVKYKFKNWKKTRTRGIRVTAAMRKRRATTIARQLNRTERWHSHGYGISMSVLRQDLKLEIDDLDKQPTRCAVVKEYHNLLDDYMSKLGHRGVLHTAGNYAPFRSI